MDFFLIADFAGEEGEMRVRRMRGRGRRERCEWRCAEAHPTQLVVRAQIARRASMSIETGYPHRQINYIVVLHLPCNSYGVGGYVGVHLFY